LRKSISGLFVVIAFLSISVFLPQTISASYDVCSKSIKNPIYDSDSKTLYLPQFVFPPAGSEKIIAIDVDTKKELSTFAETEVFLSFGIDQKTRSSAFNSETGMLYSTNIRDNSITVYDISNDKKIKTIELGKEAFYIDINQNTNRIYVSTFDLYGPERTGSLVVIDGKSNGILKEIPFNDR